MVALIQYKVNEPLNAADIIELYRAAGLPRPVDDADRIQRIFAGSNLVISAWIEGKLVGVSRSITDGAWSCYLADLAVHPDHQRHGVGRQLVEKTREAVGDETMVLLLSVPDAMEYYPKIGMEKLDNAFIFWRKY